MKYAVAPPSFFLVFFLTTCHGQKRKHNFEKLSPISATLSHTQAHPPMLLMLIQICKFSPTLIKAKLLLNQGGKTRKQGDKETDRQGLQALKLKDTRDCVHTVNNSKAKHKGLFRPIQTQGSE